MADRYTRRHAETAFRALAAALNKRVARSWDDAGAWSLDYAACYGGFCIVEKLPTGGQSCPLGYTRRPARDFCAVCWFAVEAIRQTDETAIQRVAGALTTVTT